MTDLNELHYTQLAQWAGMQRQENDAGWTTSIVVLKPHTFVDYAYTKREETSFSFNAMREELEQQQEREKISNVSRFPLIVLS